MLPLEIENLIKLKKNQLLFQDCIDEYKDILYKIEYIKNSAIFHLNMLCYDIEDYSFIEKYSYFHKFDFNLCNYIVLC